MFFRKHFSTGSCFFFLFFPLSLAAHPRVVVDTAEYRAGFIDLKRASFVKHTFTIKNEGDSAFMITKISPCCGGISVESDSIIHPYSAGHITMVLDLREILEVNFYKYIKVHTNDRGRPKVELAISGTLNFFIYFEPHSLVLPVPGTQDTVQAVVLKTAKSDLKVTAVSFILEESSLEWLASLPLRFSFDDKGEKGGGGTFVYALKIFYTPVEGKFAGYGTYTIKTNHPDKPEIRIYGALDPEKTP